VRVVSTVVATASSGACVCVCVYVVRRGRGGGGGDLAGPAAVERLDVVGLVLQHAGAVHHGVLMVACVA